MLHGKRLKGEWTLVRFHGHDGKRNHWFLIKHSDKHVIEGDDGDFVEQHNTSVVSRRTMEKIASAKDNVWNSGKKTPVSDLSKKAPRPLPEGKSELPTFIPPQLATLSTELPRGDKWLHEIKFDGYRMLAYVENGKTLMMSRNNKDWTGAFQPIAELAALLPVANAILDGEIVAMDKDKKSNFSDLKEALSAGNYEHMQYYVFDTLFLNGKDLRKHSLLERKALLKELLAKLPAKAKKRILYSDHFTDEDGRFFQGVCSMHLEGVVSKRSDAPYLSGCSKSWLKTKCIRRQEFVVGGYTLPSNGSRGIGALLLGYYDGENLEYAGRVGTGWNAELSAKLRTMLEKRATKQCPFVSVTVEGRRKALWVKPELVGEVEFTEWTPDGHLRHPSFEGLREDKEAGDVTRDFAEPVQKAQKEAVREVKQTLLKKNSVAKKAGGTASKNIVSIDDITITHPERIIYPDEGFTKRELAEYYASVSHYILPHITDRPISMLRCPEGAEEACFYQRHVGLGKSPYLHEISIGVKGESRDYMMVRDEHGLISLIQWGVIEIHPWQCTARNLDKPDRIIFDLDPDPAVTWPRMVEAALEVRTRMEELGLKSFLKTTGGKGLHVVVPLTPSYGWETLKSFAHAIAQSMAKDSPDRYIATMSKAARKGLIFVDYLRNDVTSTAVSAFSARARKGATVSTPLDWKELDAKLKLPSFSIKTLPQRLAGQKKDPWRDFFTIKQKIAAKYLKALKIDID